MLCRLRSLELRGNAIGDGTAPHHLLPAARRFGRGQKLSDGTPVLTGTASIDGDTAVPELAPRLARSQGSPPGRLHVLDHISVGQRGPGDETVSVTFGDDFGELYPFTLVEKLDAITEVLDW